MQTDSGGQVIDPETVLENLRQAIQLYKDSALAGNCLIAKEATRIMVECFDQLDEWLSRGGYKPKDWL